MSIRYVAIRWILAVTAVACAAAASAAESTHEYEYDDAGRLRKMISPTMDVSYRLDAAGNRTNVTSSTGRGWPGPVIVPPTSLTGDYTISWGASTPAAARYELYEATNAQFSGEVERYDGPALSASFLAKPDGTYYYRVRACDTGGCGPRRPGPNPISVARPPTPSQPGAMQLPSSDLDGTYAISWGASTGMLPVDGVPPDGLYELYEAVNGGAFGATPVYSGATAGTTISGRGNGTYSYRVRACNGPSCSTYRAGPNSVLVTIPPGVPGGAVVPGYHNTGSYTVTWGASSGVVTAYELLESLAFGGESLIYSGTNTSFAVSGRADGVYGYRLRACNTPAACSGYTATQGNGAVIYVDRIAPTPPTTIGLVSPAYTIYWSGGSTDTAGSGAGSGVGSWRVYRNGSHIGTSNQPQQSFTDSSPPANVTLNYTVRSVDRAGNESGPSPTYTLYIDTIAPTTPGNFRAASVTVNSVSLAWDASSDAFGISWYRIARSGSGTVMGNGDASTSYVDDTVSSNTTYTYQIFAVDGNGVESSPASVTVTTPTGAPPIPTINGPGFVQDNDGIYTISWSSSPGAAYYVLAENGAGFTVTGTSRQFNQGGNGEFVYRVRACSAANVCSGFSNAKTIRVCINFCN